MAKLNLFLILFIFRAISLTAQSYVQLGDNFNCGVSNMYSIYATPEDVLVLEQFLNKCEDLEYIRIKGFKAGPHWDKLFTLLADYKRLKGIELFYNDGLEKVPKAIKQNPGLRTISVVGNRHMNYEDLFRKLSNLDSLQRVSLVDNKLKEVPNSFKKLKSLKQLHVSGNEGLNYEHLIDNLKESELEELSIPLNSLSDIPENIKDLKKLKVLDIRKNYIAELPKGIKGLDSLQTFKSEENIFLNVNEELSKLKGLNIKYLSFDPVQDEILGEIKTIFPNAIIDRKNDNSFIDSNGDITDSEIGVDFKVAELPKQKLCDKAIKQYNGLFLKRNNYSNFDSLGFYERLSNTKYSYNEKVLADGRFEGVKLMSHNKLIQKKDLNYPRYKTKKGEIAFSVCPEGNLYPELKAFTGMLWVYVGDKSKKEFYKSYVKNKNWKDVYLEYDESNETFFVVLKGELLLKIPAYPRYVNPQSSLKHAKLQYGKKFQMYEKRLELRSVRYDKNIERLKMKSFLRKRKLENQNWNRLKTYMCEYEKSLSRQGWLDYKEHIINKNHEKIDTLDFSTELLKLSTKIKFVSFKKGEGSGNKNFLNSVSGKLSLKISQKSGFLIETKCIVYYPSIKEMVLFDSGLDGFIDFKNNIDFKVVFIKEGHLNVMERKEFLDEVNASFSIKNPIEFQISKPFKEYSMKGFWSLLN